MNPIGDMNTVRAKLLLAGAAITSGVALDPTAVFIASFLLPLVSGAYIMTLEAQEKLYPDSMPERGNPRVEFGAAQSDGVTGVIAHVVSLITGAAGEGGFKGLGGKFSRRDSLRFGLGKDTEPRITRLDMGAAVGVSYHPGIVPPPPEVPGLM